VEVQAAATRLTTDLTRGLSGAEAERRFELHGPNELERVGSRSWFAVLASQFVDVLILILLIAAGVSLAIGHATDAATIIAIVILNGVLGFGQEWRAERSLDALRRMLAPDSKAIRDGAQHIVPTRELVPGDLVVLDTGDRIPADLRLVETLNLRIDESALTGESLPVAKDTPAQPVTAHLHERRCMAWMGSAVTHGHALGLVVATGMGTEFGRIAALTQTVGDERTPLQKKLGRLGTVLGVLSLALSALVALLGWALGRPLVEMFFTGVALAVAIVPEALPIVVTTTLALGVRAMVHKHVLFRRLQAAETLGAATVICSDKTGTMTSNQMTVTLIRTATGMFEVTGAGYGPIGQFRMDGTDIDPRDHPDLLDLLETGMICSHAQIEEEATGWQARGEPTEAA
jgi:Ca2+-transporting ATPase